ncbi:MAG TPA: serine hydrolase domain-containing protein [Thermoanaerobaculia bacterium]|nr:serine hydrolase domain-containing protein [Thermoanaerobaculia bacterium]
MHSRWMIRAALLLMALAASAQPSPEMRKRIEGTIAAFNGTAHDFEKYAQEHYAKEFLAQRTAEQRAALFARLQQDFGKLGAVSVERKSPDSVAIAVKGTTGMRGQLILRHEPAPSYRISGLEMRVGGGDNEKPDLPPVPVRGTMNAAELTAALDPYLKNLQAASKFDGAVLVVRDGVTLFEKAYGYANRADKVPNTVATRFNVGSIVKEFTKVAVGRLAAEGKLSLDDTLGRHIPDHPNATAQKATIAQLLDHTAGLGDFMSPEFRATAMGRLRSNRDWYKLAASRPMTFDPGARRQYCNNCYITLGEIIERVSGMPYEQYIAKHVFEPAGMKTAGFFHTDGVEPSVATGYTTAHGPLRSSVHLRGAAGSAAGSAYASAGDLLAFDNAWRDGKLLDPKWTGWSFDGAAPATGRVTTPLGYAGGSEGVNATVESGGKWTVVVLANIDPPAAEDLGQAIYRALGGD